MNGSCIQANVTRQMTMLMFKLNYVSISKYQYIMCVLYYTDMYNVYMFKFDVVVMYMHMCLSLTLFVCICVRCNCIVPTICRII